MSGTAMGSVFDVFALRDSVIGDYKRFATSFTTIAAPDIRDQVEKLYAQERYWPEPLIQINPHYERTTDIRALTDQGALHPACADIFQAKGSPLRLYKHQEQAIALAEGGHSYVVTTGTGSGKSLCFFIPILHRVLVDKRNDRTPRTRAIVIYPMNALANSQIEELDKFVGNAPGPPPITFARYTGQETADERRRIADHPPDILLTNFMMLELLMTRQDDTDRRVIDHCVGLRFLVLDELHTYRGRQGADVALLVRRVRERLQPGDLQCIGTSATMASEGSATDKRRAVAQVASKLFSVPIADEHVILESLERITDPMASAASVASALGPAIDRGISPTLANDELRQHPLAIWVETRLGVTFSDVDHRWVRARPQTVTEAVDCLARDSGRSPDACRDALRQLLLLSSLTEQARTGSPNASPDSFFAFKLHQFISGAGHAYATLEPPGRRTVTVEGQQFLPGFPDKRLYPVHFCRECGHEYHPVRLQTDTRPRQLLPRDIDDAPPAPSPDEPANEAGNEAEQFGFVTVFGTRDSEFTFADRDEDYPEAWLEYDAAGNARLSSYYRRWRVQRITVLPDGSLSPSGPTAWFIPGKFRFCLRCGHTPSAKARDRTRLASLSAEGRSSATTVLVSSALRWLHGERSGLEPYTRKLLGFTDNRQDAALQSGHFNDFLFVSLIRAGFLGALKAAGERGLRSDELGLAQQKALGFDRTDDALRAEWLQDPTIKGFNLQDAESTLRQVLAYRVWFDQRRGWRYTNPNLEQLGLVQVEYLGLETLVQDQAEFDHAHPLLQRATPAVRTHLYRTLFDHLRQWMAIKSQVLDPVVLEQLTARSHSRLRQPWGFGIDERPRGCRWMMVVAPKRKETSLRDTTDLLVRGGSRSALGKTLRNSTLWNGDGAIRNLKAAEFDRLVGDLLRAAARHGLLSQDNSPFDQPGWRLNDAAVLFRLRPPETDGSSSSKNAFFRDLYDNLAAMLTTPSHPLFGFEAREHTAQVRGEVRAVREKRFRYGDKEQTELKAQDNELRELGEPNRFLPVLFCSPTMELGVDISTLNAVHLRNVPPTPANYAQRSGRAGRSGQAALVLTYCSSQSPHDQYFFRDPRAMVHGEVKAPLFDLANRDLIDSHLLAVWLSCVEQPLDAGIGNLLVLADPARPLSETLTTAMRDERVTRTATERIGRVLDIVAAELTPELAPWYTDRDAYAKTIAASAFGRFNRAFDRWRALFAAAETQRDAARRTMDDYVAPYVEKRAAQVHHTQAIAQLDLLQRSVNSPAGQFSKDSFSDFYTYRYLATEGFLPGYNFPRLPLMAYIPGGTDGRGRQTYLQRPRFLALAEFGPHSLVYHEGRAYRVTRALLALSRRDAASPDMLLPTQSVRICNHCGAGHFEDQTSMCHACGFGLGTADIIQHIYRIENVATQPADRITANDEERQRQGFELQTTFEWATRDHDLDVRFATAADSAGDIARLAYGAGATITRLNKGLRRRADKKTLGFRIDPVTGYWAKNDDDDDDDDNPDPTATPRQWIVPSVQDRKNALHILPAESPLTDTTLATLQHALLRGTEAIFQLEEGEILAEPMPSRAVRKGFLCYEATEGGAGVLIRLAAEPDHLATVARKALQIMHFDIPDTGSVPTDPASLADQPGAACVAACYRCLLSYFNQPDHELIDRRDPEVRGLLLRLAMSHVGTTPTPPPHGLDATAPGAAGDWAHEAQTRGLPPADAEPLAVGATTFPWVWRRHYVIAIADDLAPETAAQLDDWGFEVIDFRDRSLWHKSFLHLAKLLGRSS